MGLGNLPEHPRLGRGTEVPHRHRTEDKRRNGVKPPSPTTPKRVCLSSTPQCGRAMFSPGRARLLIRLRKTAVPSRSGLKTAMVRRQWEDQGRGGGETRSRTNPHGVYSPRSSGSRTAVDMSCPAPLAKGVGFIHRLLLLLLGMGQVKSSQENGYDDGDMSFMYGWVLPFILGWGVIADGQWERSDRSDRDGG
jgi:hypothetical protein